MRWSIVACVYKHRKRNKFDPQGPPHEGTSSAWWTWCPRWRGCSPCAQLVLPCQGSSRRPGPSAAGASSWLHCCSLTWRRECAQVRAALPRRRLSCTRARFAPTCPKHHDQCRSRLWLSWLPSFCPVAFDAPDPPVGGGRRSRRCSRRCLRWQCACQPAQLDDQQCGALSRTWRASCIFTLLLGRSPVSCLRVSAKFSCQAVLNMAPGAQPLDFSKHRCMPHRRSVLQWSNMSRNQSCTMGSAWILRRLAALPLGSSSKSAAHMWVRLLGPSPSRPGSWSPSAWKPPPSPQPHCQRFVWIVTVAIFTSFNFFGVPMISPPLI